MAQQWTWLDEVGEINRAWRLKWAKDHPGLDRPEWSEMLLQGWMAGEKHTTQVYLYEVWDTVEGMNANPIG